MLEVIDRCTAPTLVFDAARIEANLAEVAAAARASDVTALFAAKSFPHPEVRRLAGARLAGFDVASVGEVEEVRGLGGILSVGDPSGRAMAAARAWPGRLIVGCETVAQVEAAPARAEIAIRVSASVTGRDPAVGAVLDGSGHRRSRFGLELRARIEEIASAAGPRRVGLHVHHGPVSATSGARFVETAKAVLAVAGFDVEFLNLGGAWHAVADLAAALREVRAAMPGVEILIEPGRRIVEGAGFACGRVMAARELEDRRLCVVDLSRVAHLRWSQVELVAPPARTGHGRVTLFAGPTCYEDDAIGEWTVERFAEGQRVVLRGVTGYAVAWNTGFGGVAPAEVVIG
jgi:diaminopimelate decarboxylase